MSDGTTAAPLLLHGFDLHRLLGRGYQLAPWPNVAPAAARTLVCCRTCGWLVVLPAPVTPLAPGTLATLLRRLLDHETTHGFACGRYDVVAWDAALARMRERRTLTMEERRRRYARPVVRKPLPR